MACHILGPIRWPIKWFVTFSAYISSRTLHRSVQLDIIFNVLGKNSTTLMYYYNRPSCQWVALSVSRLVHESSCQVVELSEVELSEGRVVWHSDWAPRPDQYTWPFWPWNPGGPLVFEVGYHPRKKIHVIRVVFQDQAMYARTSFRGAKTCKIGKKGYVFGHMTNFGKDMTDKLKKNACKNAYLGFIFIPAKYVFRVCFESPFTRMISNLKYK